MSATDRWGDQLRAWALPEELLATAEQSPYGHPPQLWKRRTAQFVEGGESTPTMEAVVRLAGEGGSVLDVGAGAGRYSVWLAARGHRVTAVERSPGMIAALADACRGLDVAIVDGSWPAVASMVNEHKVVLCAHVVYDVQDIAPFVASLSERATSAVVIEMTPVHPWSNLAPLYRALHDLDRPTGPTHDDLVEVLREVPGVEPEVETWSRPSDLWYESWDELLDFYGRRLVLPKARWSELRVLLEPDVVETDDRLTVGTRDRDLVTVSFRPSAG
jgi:SAM-dependent methyltransferase